MKERFRPVFLTGIARSGTNLVGRMLCANPGVMVSIDAYLPLFRSLRNALLRHREGYEIGGKRRKEALQDSYFGGEEIRDLDCLHGGNLDLRFDSEEWPTLQAQLKSRASDDAADLVPHLSQLHGAETYRELFDRALAVIAKARNAEDRAWIGMKDVWVVDFFPAIARSYPGARFILILRDPRAAVASNQPAKGTSQFGHPISYARHWRKNVADAVRYRDDSLLASRCLVVFYEDVLRNPEGEARKWCEFLDLPFDPAMTDPSQFKDFTRGGVWAGNSSFENTPEIDARRADRWRRGLEPEIARTVDFVCGPEMRLAGYVPDKDYREERPEPEVLEYYIRSNQDPCSWRSDSGDPLEDYGRELFRYALLNFSTGAAPPDLIRRCFLFEEVYGLVRNRSLDVLRTGHGRDRA
ncbi:MAG: sulfotransferase [Thermodesulfobacteriota bacterium]